MTPIWGNIGKRHQDESSILKSRMRQDQLLRCFLHLSDKGQIAPKCVRLSIRNHRVICRQKIQIQRSLTPPHVSGATKRIFDLVKDRDHFVWIHGSL